MRLNLTTMILDLNFKSFSTEQLELSVLGCN